MARDDNKYSREDQAARTRSAEVGKGKSTQASLNSRNPYSSAKGPYQMLDGTWKDMEKLAGKKLNRQSPEDNELAFQLYTKQSEKALEQNGLEVNPGNTYALHVYGPKGGIAFLKKIKSNPTGLAIDGMSKEVINGNKPFFYDEKGRPRTNSDSYNTLSTRVGGPTDPGAITLSKNLEREQIENEQRQIQMQQNEMEQAAEDQQQLQQQDPNQIPEEQSTDPNQVQNQQEQPIQETSPLSRASNRAGLLYTGNRATDANFVLPAEPIQEDIKTSGESVQKMKTFKYGGVTKMMNKKLAYGGDGEDEDDKVNIKDTRKVRATTKKAINPNVDLISGKYSRKVINNVIDASLKHGVDPNTALALGMQESKLGNENENIGQIVGGSNYGDAENDMVRFYKEKAEIAKKKGRKTDEAILQMYNGTGKIYPNTEKVDRGYAMKKIYGVPVPAGGIDMGKTNLYGIQVKDVRDNVIKKSPIVQKIIKDRTGNFNFFEGQPYKSGPPQLTIEEPLLNSSNTYNVNPKYFALGGFIDPGKSTAPVLPTLNQIKNAQTDSDPHFNTKSIVKYQPGVTSGKKGESGFYIYSRTPEMGNFNPDTDREFIRNTEMKYLQRTPQWKTFAASQGNRFDYGGYSYPNVEEYGPDRTMNTNTDNLGFLNSFNEGGSHEDNPNGGVPQGYSGDGSQNTVEQGETKMGNYVFSDRLVLDKADIENLYLPREVEGMTYAEASKWINSFLEESPFDITIKRTVKGQLESLKVGNDRARRYKEEEENLVAENEIQKETRNNPEIQNSIVRQLPQPGADQIPGSIEGEESGLNKPYRFGSYLAGRRELYANGGFIYDRSFNPQDNVGLDYTKKTPELSPSPVNDPNAGNNASVLGNAAGAMGSIGGTAGTAGNVVGAASTGIGMGMDAFKKFNTRDVNGEDIKKVNTGGAIAKGAASGAATGAMFGPWGAAIGGVIGGALGGIGASRQNKARTKQAINKSDYRFNIKAMEGPEFTDAPVAKYGGMQKKYALGGQEDPTYPFPWFGNNFNTSANDNGFSTQLLKRQIANANANNLDANKYLYQPNALGFAMESFTPKTSINQPGKYNRMLQDSVNTQTNLIGSSGSDERPSNFRMKGTSPLQYVEGIGSLVNYLDARKAKPRTISSEQYRKLSTPSYYDEAFLQNQIAKEGNNASNVITNTAEGNGAVARAMYLASGDNLNKLRSDAYFKMDEVNRGIRERDQAEAQRIADANVGVRNQDYQANLQEEDYVRARRELARDNLIKSIGNIGREQSDRNMIYNLTGGYKTDGTYDPENKTSLWGQGVDLYKKVRGRSKGGLIDAYEKATTPNENELALDYLNRKYNGKI